MKKHLSTAFLLALATQAQAEIIRLECNVNQREIFIETYLGGEKQNHFERERLSEIHYWRLDISKEGYTEGYKNADEVAHVGITDENFMKLIFNANDEREWKVEINRYSGAYKIVFTNPNKNDEGHTIFSDTGTCEVQNAQRKF